MRWWIATLAPALGACWTGLDPGGTVRRSPPDTFLLDTGGDGGGTDVDPGTNVDPGTDVDPDTDPPPPLPVEACYLGPDRDHGACIPVGPVAPLPAGYAYPPPPGGDPRFREALQFLDLGVLDDQTALAPNFRLYEFAPPSGRYAVVQPRAVVRLQAIRDVLGPLVVEVGYLSPGEAVAAGLGSDSRHPYGDGFLLRATRASPSEVAAECGRQGADVVQTGATAVYCDWRSEPMDPAFFGWP